MKVLPIPCRKRPKATTDSERSSHTHPSGGICSRNARYRIPREKLKRSAQQHIRRTQARRQHGNPPDEPMQNQHHTNGATRRRSDASVIRIRKQMSDIPWHASVMMWKVPQTARVVNPNLSWEWTMQSVNLHSNTSTCIKVNVTSQTSSKVGHSSTGSTKLINMVVRRTSSE